MDADILSGLQHELDGRRTADLAEYRRLLGIATPSPQERGRIVALAQSLGKTAEDLKRDATALSDIAQTQQQLATAQDPEKQKLLERLKIERAEHREKTEELMEARAQEFLKIHQRVTSVEHEIGEARNYANRLKKLQSENWELLGFPRQPANPGNVY